MDKTEEAEHEIKDAYNKLTGIHNGKNDDIQKAEEISEKILKSQTYKKLILPKFSLSYYYSHHSFDFLQFHSYLVLSLIY